MPGAGVSGRTRPMHPHPFRDKAHLQRLRAALIIPPPERQGFRPDTANFHAIKPLTLPDILEHRHLG